MSKAEVQAHGAHTVWRLRKYKAILKLLPPILEKSNAQALGTIALVLMSIGGAIGIGVAVDGYGFQHPVQLIGHCPYPLVLNGDGCFQVHSSTDANGKVTNSLTPAGTVDWPNGTNYRGP